MRNFYRTLLVVVEATICWAALPPAVGAQGESPPALSISKIGAEFGQLIEGLDSPCYDTRELAAQRLEQMVATPAYGNFLAEKFHQLAVRPDISYEVRRRISPWRTRLPAVISARPPSVSAEEIDRLVRLLDDDAFSVRVGAGERLQWLAGDQRLAGMIMALLKDRLTSGDLSGEALRRLDEAWDVAWGMWLNSEAAKGLLPAASDRQISGWIEDLLRPMTQPRGQFSPGSVADRAAVRRHQIARHELLGALARDQDALRIRAALQSTIESRSSEAAREKAAADLRELTDLLRPSMVAEIWRGHQQITEQHLVIGVPQMSPLSLRPSHFDAITETIAHCVSGNTLSPGDYPVGIAFPMPRAHGEGLFFLVNLSTPRRQIAYTYYAKTDARARLAAISRRTLDHFLATKRVLRDDEVAMLGQLDLDEVSRFASRYFMQIEDKAADDELDLEGDAPIGHVTGKVSLFGAICEQLAMGGTHEAAPGLLEAMRKKRFLPVTAQCPYQLPWIAALAIAQRDPWPEADAWLAEVSTSREPLVTGQPQRPELGATAAALLLKHHGANLREFGLQPEVELKINGRLGGVLGYRYSSAEDPRRVREWWSRKKKDEG
jgi:hypothetical protein